MNDKHLAELLKIQEEITKQQDIVIDLLKQRIIYLEEKIKEMDNKYLEFLDNLQSTLTDRK